MAGEDSVGQAVDALRRGDAASAERLLRKEVAAQPGDADAWGVLGVVLDQEKKYPEADTAYRHALAAGSPSAGLLNNYGNHFMAIHDLDRAREQYEKALALDPAKVNARTQLAQVLYELAAVDLKHGRPEIAAEQLARASKLNSERADVQQLLAQVMARLGYFADSAQAWERYLKLAPHDASARREHAFVETAIADRADAGISELRTYVSDNPRDAVAHYELGTVETANDLDAAAKDFDRAIELKPDLVAARFARGLLLYRQGQDRSCSGRF